MLRTNSKVVKNSVKNYVMECLMDDSAYIENGMDGIMEWYKLGGWNVSLGEFLVDYANVFTPWYFEQRQLLKEWLCETEEESNKYDDEKVHKLFINLVNRELNNLRGIR